jgi:CRISPR-associated protein Cmr1
MKLIFNAELKNDTPVFLGGYDTLYARDGISEGLRSQSLKGLMRYWMRVYFATQGYNLEEINEQTNSILGGKSKDGKELLTSKIKISCYIKVDTPSDYINSNITRIKLLRLGEGRRKDAEKLERNKLNYAEKLESELSLYDVNGDLNDKNKRLVIGSLITSIILSGIGKMSRRGFGCFSMEIKEEDTRVFREKVKKVFSSDRLDDKITNIKEIIKQTKECIPERNYGNDLPPIHAFSHCKMYIIKIQDKMQTIQDLQRFTVRSLRRIRPDTITNKHLAWFLGLPREQRGTGYTGYINNIEIERRASPMFIAIHNDFAIITIFKSKDWPLQIKWKGKFTENIKVTDNNINEAYNVISKELKGYLLNKGYEVKEIDLN